MTLLAACAGPPPGPKPDEIFRAFLRVLERLLRPAKEKP